MKTLSLVMIVKDEEKTIGKCLEHAHAAVDEIIVVDTGSTDATKQIAAEYNAKIYDFPWNHHFSEARNYAIAQATSDWNFVLDADEYMSAGGRDVLRHFINNKQALGRVKIINRSVNNQGIESHVISYITRVFPRNTYYTGRIHEQLVSDLPRVQLPIEVHHDGYYKTDKTGRNIPLLEMELQDHPHDHYVMYQLAKEYKASGDLHRAYTHIKRAYQSVAKVESYYPLIVIDYLNIVKEMQYFQEGLEVISAEQHALHDYPDFHFARGAFYLDVMISDPQQHWHFLPAIEEAYKTCIALGETTKYDTVAGMGSFIAWYNLGVYYEVQGKMAEAVNCYRQSAAYNYQPANHRLKDLGITP